MPLIQGQRRGCRLPASATFPHLLPFAEAVRIAAGGGGRIVFQPLPKDDRKQRRPDITRARTLLGWEPRVPLEQELAETLTWFRKVLGVRAPASRAEFTESAAV